MAAASRYKRFLNSPPAVSILVESTLTSLFLKLIFFAVIGGAGPQQSKF